MVAGIFTGLLYWISHSFDAAAATFFFVVVPAFVIQIFSATWLLNDGKRKTFCCFCVHIFHLQPLQR